MRPKNAFAPTEPDIELSDDVSVAEGILSAFVLTLLFPDELFDFAVEDMPALSTDVPLDFATCRVGLVAKCAAVMDGLDNEDVADTDVVATDLRSATLFIPAGARPHLLDTQPPTLPIKPRPLVF